MKKIVLLNLFIIFTFVASAQKQLEIQPQSYRDSSGTLFWNLKLPVYLQISSTPNGKADALTNKEQAEYTQPYYFEKEGLNTFMTQGGLNNQTQKANSKLIIQFPIIADGTAPETKSLFLTAQKGINNKSAYYGPGLQIQLTAFDKYAGVKQIYYSLNGVDFQNYTTILTISEQGDYSLQYYAVDFVGNAENVHEISFRVDTQVPQTTHRIVGEYLPELETVSERTTIELLPVDTAAEVKKTVYLIDNTASKIYDGKPIAIKTLSNGFHTIRYFSVDKVGNNEDTVSYQFYLDKLPPILSSDVLGDRYEVNDQVYFSGRTKFKLICVDNKSGIDSLRYSIDRSPYENYTDAFYLPRIPGIHQVSYYAKDKFGNTTRSESWENTPYQTYQYNVEKIYIDLVGPSIFAKFTGFYYFVNDTVLLGKDAAIQLFGTDNESGLQYISYSLDGIKEETTYTKPITVSTHGKHHLEYFGYDNVNNRNIGDLVFYADFNPPTIFTYFNVETIGKQDNFDVYPSNAMLYVAATDEQVGTKNIEYTINGSARLPYTTAIRNFKLNEVNEVIIYATDNLNNTAEQQLDFFVRGK